MVAGSSRARRSTCGRVLGSRVARWLLVVALIPALVLGAFGGTTLLAHAHDGHGTHFHIASSEAQARYSAEQHRHAHALGTDTCAPPEQACGHGEHGVCSECSVVPIDEHDGPSSTGEHDGVVVTVPDHEQLATRGIALPRSLTAAYVFQSVPAILRPRPDDGEEMGSPGGCGVGGPRHLLALTASQRLVRTSNALLI